MQQQITRPQYQNEHKPLKLFSSEWLRSTKGHSATTDTISRKQFIVKMTPLALTFDTNGNIQFKLGVITKDFGTTGSSIAVSK